MISGICFAGHASDSLAFLSLVQHGIQLTGEKFAIEVAVDIGVDVCIDSGFSKSFALASHNADRQYQIRRQSSIKMKPHSTDR